MVSNLQTEELACVPNDSPEGEDYCKAMSCALNFAWCNRQMITHWTRKAFERIFGMNEHTLNMQLVYDVSHNIAKVERHRIDGEGMRDLVIHRKGATRSFLEEQQLPAKYNGIGQPVIIPGSMGTASWGTLGNKKSSDLKLWINWLMAPEGLCRDRLQKRTHSVDEVEVHWRRRESI